VNHPKRATAGMACRPLAVAIAVGLLCATGASPAHAVQYHWTGQASSDWHNAGNWLNVPVEDADVVIDQVLPNPGRLGSGNVSIGSLLVGAQGKGMLTVDGGASLNMSGSVPGTYDVGVVLGDQTGSEGTLVVSGVGTSLTVGNTVQIGSAGTGALKVYQGGKVSLAQAAAYAEIVVGFGYYGDGDGAANGRGSILVDGPGSALDYAGGINLANGEMTISGAGQVTSYQRSADAGTTWLDVIGYGQEAGGGMDALDGVAKVTVTGAGSAWNSVNGLELGRGGRGELSVLDGATTSFRGQATLGLARYAYDPVTYQPILPGKAGSANVTVSGAGSTLWILNGNGIAGDLMIGDTGEAAVTVDDGGELHVDDWVIVGSQSHGSLDVASGGTVTVAGDFGNGIGIVLGSGKGTHGELTVTGSGSMLTADANMQIGDAGTGELSVRDGGIVNIGLSTAYSEVMIGHGSYGFPEGVEDGTGTITVDGNGSTLNYAGGINLLDGSVSITGGGHLQSHVREADGDAFWMDMIGFGTSEVAEWSHPELVGSGEVTVSGAGSKWDSVNGLIVGQGAPGKLSILDGGHAGFLGEVGLGRTGYLTNGDQPLVGLRSGAGEVLVSGAGSSLTVQAAPANTIGGDGDLLVGVAGPGHLTVEQSGKVAVDGHLLVGGRAQGNLLVSSGGKLTVAGSDDSGIGATLGREAGVQGELTVTGAGSMLTVDAGTQIGNAGTGVLSVLDGGTANLGLSAAYSEIMVGLGSYGFPEGVQDGTGAIVVDGAGSTLNYAGGLNLLDGSLSITGGGQVLSQARAADGGASWLDLLGYGSPEITDWAHPELAGTAEVTVSGAGSTWASVNGLNVGHGGSGTLSILDGGQASFEQQIGLGRYGYLTDENGQIVGTRTGSANVLVSGEGSRLAALGDGQHPAAGMIRVGMEGDAALQVSDGGAVSAVSGINIGAKGSMTIGSGSADGAAGMVDAPLVTVDGQLAFAHGSSAYVFAPGIDGSGAIDFRSGFTRLTGDGSAFEGHASVADGAVLSVNGSLGGDVTVAAGGRLEGTGTVGDAVVGGTLAPGNSPGILHVDGDLTMLAGSTYEAQIDPVSGKYDSVQVNGQVTIQEGTTLDVQNLSDQPLAPGMNLKLIETATPIDGQFSEVTGALTPLLGYGISYDGGTINLEVIRSAVTFASLGTTSTQRAMGTALDALPAGSALATLLYNEVRQEADAPVALERMAGPIHADLRRVMLDDSRLPRDAVMKRLAEADAAGSALWVQGMGHWGSTDADGGTPKAKANGSGVLLGVDGAVSGSTRLGAAVGTGQTSYRMPGSSASAHITSRHLALYGQSVAGAMRFGYGAAASWNDVRSDRSFAIGMVPQELHANYHANSTQAFVDAGYRFGSQDKRWAEPFVSVAHVRLRSDDVRETGGVTALATQGGHDDATFGTLGLRWSAAAGAMQWRGQLGWRHAFGFDRAVVRQSFVEGGGSFDMPGLPMAQNAAVVELGGRFDISRRVHVSADYTGQLASSSRDHAARMSLTVDL